MKVNTIFMGLALLCAASSFAMGSEVGPKKQIRKKKAKQEKAEELFLPDSCQFGNCWDGVGASVNDQRDIYFGR
jgi:hypothetical protein